MLKYTLLAFQDMVSPLPSFSGSDNLNIETGADKKYLILGNLQVELELIGTILEHI